MSDDENKPEEYKPWPPLYNFEMEVAEVIKDEVVPKRKDPVEFREYRGLGYRAASQEAERLIRRFGWFQSFERLAALREILVREHEKKR